MNPENVSAHHRVRGTSSPLVTPGRGVVIVGRSLLEAPLVDGGVGPVWTVGDRALVNGILRMDRVPALPPTVIDGRPSGELSPDSPPPWARPQRLYADSSPTIAVAPEEADASRSSAALPADAPGSDDGRARRAEPPKAGAPRCRLAEPLVPRWVLVAAVALSGLAYGVIRGVAAPRQERSPRGAIVDVRTAPTTPRATGERLTRTSERP